MLEFTTNNFLFFSRKEVWFYNGEKVTEGSYTVYTAAQKTIQGRTTFLEKYNTTIIDLSKTEIELQNAIHPTFRYDIRIAEKNSITTLLIDNPTQKDCLKLINDYNRFAFEKKLKPMKKNWLMTLQKKESIYISKAFSGNTEIATHVYIFDDETISLSSSFHDNTYTDQKLRSAANKLLHWKDIIAFKNRGFLQYDFGGLNMTKLPGVSKFKMSFGGKTTENYRFIKTHSLIYRLIKLLNRS
ncbi:MAG: hypothetical protein ACXVPN_05650 [Bacteroidia bacterium]